MYTLGKERRELDSNSVMHRATVGLAYSSPYRESPPMQAPTNRCVPQLWARKCRELGIFFYVFQGHRVDSAFQLLKWMRFV